ncbi:hypothetical protein Srot_0730 [Segniliparus rotundus DSM 44985]|uniref:Uncharacterized protein n=1 Tax=Segniliparus rotundus (strain ATCC BAA-972 / CDC 1076 / CIP 108378 / DSM 44985 / JCM 13578) TaxID=640132 RepID=D6ZDE6_SEGRD|nr:hypothetical protein [Segniliparus rotundus]ADG97210.1 hypothetical protein Srot_0730 [Segniliparus rotundus DSM 44985]
MPSIKLPAISWAAATWSAPIITAVCEILYSIIGYFLPHEAASERPALIMTCSVMACAALLLPLIWRTPRWGGAAIGCLIVPVVLAVLRENVTF